MRILRNSRGQGMTEYIIIVAIIAIAAVAAFKVFGGKVKDGIKASGDVLEQTVNEGKKSAEEGSD
ncbi:MAG: hypothetical protein JNL74_00560 [Fibrobacteres bacterium]|nr:hypothetical protein [Fibrobacterota bacterium]